MNKGGECMDGSMSVENFMYVRMYISGQVGGQVGEQIFNYFCEGRIGQSRSLKIQKRECLIKPENLGSTAEVQDWRVISSFET